MYAVVRTGGKQYRVAKDDVLELERLTGQAGDKIILTDVLLIGENGKKPTIGAPVVEGASVTAEVVAQTRGEKIDVIKFKRRKNYRRQLGHRQDLTKVKITNIAKTTAKTDTAKKADAPKKAIPKKTVTKKATPKKTVAKKATPKDTKNKE